MELLLVVLCISFTAILTCTLYFAYRVIQIIDKEKVIQHQVVGQDPIFTPQKAADNSDYINPLEDEGLPLDQFTPDFKKEIKVKFENDGEDVLTEDE